MEIKEEIVRVITKDGATYVLGAPLPQPVGQDPEPVSVIYIELSYSPDEGEDIFRIFCKPDEGSHYEREGLMVITSVPYSEVTRWDSVTNQEETIQAINDYRLGVEEDEESSESDTETESDDNSDAGEKNEQSKGIEENKVR